MNPNARFAALLAAVLCLASWQAHAADTQTITSGDLDRVFNAIEHDKWRVAEQETVPLIQRDVQAQRHLIARLRYVYLVSIAVQLERRELKYADLKKKLSLVEGRLVIQPWHPVKAHGDACFNLICADKDKPSTLRTAQTNPDATQIYSFDYVDVGSPVDISSYDGQNARLGGILDRVEVNPNLAQAQKVGAGVTWFFRLFIKDGFIDFER